MSAPSSAGPWLRHVVGEPLTVAGAIVVPVSRVRLDAVRNGGLFWATGGIAPAGVVVSAGGAIRLLQLPDEPPIPEQILERAARLAAESR